MAEERSPLGANQRLAAAAAVLIIFVFIGMFFLFRSCGPAAPKMTVIYSNLDLTESAKVVTRLKELKINYEIRDSGTAVAVKKDEADKARLGLAEKNLPAGGVVGWEIFNETKMGATDFDRRIQLIRAISGELSRTIKRIDGVEDARVQIVIPETRLFEVAKAPVTASVLLRLNPGSRLKVEQIRGIIYLVASSVENLKPENVTVVDYTGKILSGLITLPAPLVSEQTVSPEAAAAKVSLPTKEATVEAVTTIVTKEVKTVQLTEEERMLLRIKAKEEYERQLATKAQSFVNNFLPANTAIVKATIEFGLPVKKKNQFTRLKIKSDSSYLTADVKRITMVVLVDKKYNLTKDDRKNIYSSIALAIPYDGSRGDKIVIQRVPFHNVMASFEDMKKHPAAKKENMVFPALGQKMLWAGAAAIALFLAVFLLRGRKKERPEIREERLSADVPTAEEAQDAVFQIKDLAEKNPEKIANLLKKWLMEAEEG